MKFPHTRAARALVAAAIVGLSACTDQPGAALPTGAQNGATVNLGSTQDAAHHKLARLLAAGLRSPQVRAALKADLAASPVNSGKLYLSGYLRGQGAPLLRAMSQAGGGSEAYVFQLLGSVPALEIYFPVDQHRVLWDGGDNLIVAASLDEETAPFGVHVDGRPATLSADVPPSTPTIAIVPAESFNELGAAYASDLRAAVEPAQPSRSGASSPAGPRFSTAALSCQYNAHVANPTWQRELKVEEYMSCVRAWNDHEPWWKDDAEFTLMFAATNDTDAEAELRTAINIPNVWSNDTGWKTLPSPIKIALYDTDYGTRVHFRCIERDGGSTYTFKVTGTTELGKAPLTQKVGFEAGFQYRDDDDNCGEYYMTLRFTDGQWLPIPNGVSPVYDGTSDLQWYGYGVQY